VARVRFHRQNLPTSYASAISMTISCLKSSCDCRLPNTPLSAHRFARNVEMYCSKTPHRWDTVYDVITDPSKTNFDTQDLLPQVPITRSKAREFSLWFEGKMRAKECIQVQEKAVHVTLQVRPIQVRIVLRIRNKHMGTQMESDLSEQMLDGNFKILAFVWDTFQPNRTVGLNVMGVDILARSVDARNELNELFLVCSKRSKRHAARAKPPVATVTFCINSYFLSFFW